MRHLLSKIHRFLDKPMKGQAYRSLEFTKENQFCDATVDQVCRKLSLNSKSLGIRQELILWIDPYEVSLRYDSCFFFFFLPFNSCDRRYTHILEVMM